MSADSILVRQGTLEDYARAREVIAATFAFHLQDAPEFFQQTDTPPPTEKEIARLLQDEAGTWLLAEQTEQMEQAGGVVGFLTIRLRPAPQEPFLAPETRAHVDNLGVLPQWRGHGIGQVLMQAAEEWARQHGARRLMLNVWEFNHRAVAFYERMGYATFTRNLWKAL